MIRLVAHGTVRYSGRLVVPSCLRPSQSSLFIGVVQRASASSQTKDQLPKADLAAQTNGFGERRGSAQVLLPKAFADKFEAEKAAGVTIGEGTPTLSQLLSAGVLVVSPSPNRAASVFNRLAEELPPGAPPSAALASVAMDSVSSNAKAPVNATSKKAALTGGDPATGKTKPRVKRAKTSAAQPLASPASHSLAKGGNGKKFSTDGVSLSRSEAIRALRVVAAAENAAVQISPGASGRNVEVLLRLHRTLKHVHLETMFHTDANECKLFFQRLDRIASQMRLLSKKDDSNLSEADCLQLFYLNIGYLVTFFGDHEEMFDTVDGLDTEVMRTEILEKAGISDIRSVLTRISNAIGHDLERQRIDTFLYNSWLTLYTSARCPPELTLFIHNKYMNIEGVNYTIQHPSEWPPLPTDHEKCMEYFNPVYFRRLRATLRPNGQWRAPPEWDLVRIYSFNESRFEMLESLETTFSSQREGGIFSLDHRPYIKPGDRPVQILRFSRVLRELFENLKVRRSDIHHQDCVSRNIRLKRLIKQVPEIVELPFIVDEFAKERGLARPLLLRLWGSVVREAWTHLRSLANTK